MLLGFDPLIFAGGLVRSVVFRVFWDILRFLQDEAIRESCRGRSKERT
jgi:hypothetical protein